MPVSALGLGDTAVKNTEWPLTLGIFRQAKDAFLSLKKRTSVYLNVNTGYLQGEILCMHFLKLWLFCNVLISSNEQKQLFPF